MGTTTKGTLAGTGAAAGPVTTTLTFLGAARTVTGSKILLRVGDRRVLIDAGLFQGEKRYRLMNWAPFPIDPASMSDVVLTHAHLDHVGYLPALVRHGFSGPIWCSEGTRQLAEIVLRDAAKLQEEEAADANRHGFSKHTPALALYSLADVERLLPQMVGLEFDVDVELTGNQRPPFRAVPHEVVTIRLTRAAHILGSASVNVWTGTASVLFSGDLGRHDHPVLKPRQTPPGASTVVIETTYGDREHPEPANLPHEGFADVIRRTIGRGGTVLVPAFAIDRTEVVLKAISDMERAGRIPNVPVYVNSPMGVRALRVYQTLTDELRSDLRPEDFVDVPDLTAVETTEDSKALTAPGGHGPCVIISSSGMATGGRVLHHLEQLLPEARNAVVLTGYQGVGTRGRRLAEGEAQIKIRGTYVPVRAEIYHDREFSVHGDCSDLLDWLTDLSPAPSQVLCVHGEEDAANAFATRVRHEVGLNVAVPALGEVVVADDRARSTHPAAAVKPPVALPSAEARRPAPSAVTTSGYRLVTASDEAELGRLVGEALSLGWQLYGNPTVALDGERRVVAQAVIQPGVTSAAGARR